MFKNPPWLTKKATHQKEPEFQDILPESLMKLAPKYHLFTAPQKPRVKKSQVNPCSKHS
jgi:hypothetical protein